MRLSSHVVVFGGAVAALVQADPLALPPDFHRFAACAQNITWKYCGDENAPRECGRFEVPLDYRNVTAGKASLAVARYPSIKQPKLGTLFINPGGPGMCNPLSSLSG